MPKRKNKYGDSKWTAVIGLTGGIGCGKSTALKEFKKRGAFVLSADQIVHELYRQSSIKKWIKAHLGSNVVNSRQKLDRKKMGEIVFSDAKVRKNLEEYIHPKVDDVIRSRLTHHKGRVAIIEIPLLFEVGWKKKFSRVLMIAATQNVVLARNKNLERKQFINRSSAQWPIKKKIRMADTVIKNNGSMSQFKRKIGRYWNQLIQK